MSISEKTKSLLLGLSIGDALGVPFEFMESEELENECFDLMKGYGTYNQPSGSFSDDSSLTFCLIEALMNQLNQKETANLFIKWKNEHYWTANNDTFDIGNTTYLALENIEKGYSIDQAAPKDEKSCGNGALMRVLPLAFYIDNLNYDEIYNLIVSHAAITHGHIRSHMACFILVVYANKLMHLKEVSKIAKTKCFAYTMTDIHNYFISQKRFEIELIYFERFFSTFPNKLKDIKNSGYVIDSLESSFSSFLKFNRYEMIVIDSIKKGGDTDTNACIAGGLAGLFYGSDNIPKKWIEGLLRKEDIIYLSEKWAKSLIEK